MSLLICRPKDYFVRMKWWCLIIWLLTLAGSRARAAETVLWQADFSHGLPADWENYAFFGKKTDYTVIHNGTNTFLHASAVDACSALSIKLAMPAAGQLKLRWRWHIDGICPRGTERELATFDHAARVFVAFDTFLGPPRSLNYVWANVEPVGDLLAHPKSGRAQMFMVESGNPKAGQWLTEERDLAADWKRAFPDRPMPKVVGVGVMTDSDSLGGTVTGDYADIELIGE